MQKIDALILTVGAHKLTDKESFKNRKRGQKSINPFEAAKG